MHHVLSSRRLVSRYILLIKKIPVGQHPNRTIRIIGDKQKAYFKITPLGKEILKLCESYKRTNEKK